MSFISEDARMGTVSLRVPDLHRSTVFYRNVLGFRILTEDGSAALLGADEIPLLELEEAPDAPPRPQGTTGLFHVAFRLPSRRDLGAMIARVRDAPWPFQGFADHAVSEAAYLADPEGNGVELYTDRPRETWRREGDELVITTDPLDVPSLLAEADGPAPGLPAGADVGHVHLRVSTLEAAEAFYVGRLGFEVVTRRYPGALFVAAGDYHHHLGLNVWGGSGWPAPPAGSLGLSAFTIVAPGADDADLHDLDGNRVRIRGGVSLPPRS